MAEDQEPQDQELEVYQEVGRRIRAARTRVGLTQAELADRLGMKRPYVMHLESGTANPTLKTMVRLSYALGLNLSDLIPATGTSTPEHSEVAEVRRACDSLITLLSSLPGQLESMLSKDLKGLMKLRTSLDTVSRGQEAELQDGHTGPPG